MTIASREAEAIFVNEGYREAYKTLPGAKPRKFSSFDRHPFESQTASGTPSGAYGITVATWRNFSKKILRLSDDEMSFTPDIQDRIAVAIMEQTGNALGHVRKGDIEKAAQVLAKNQWPSLPPGSQTRGFTVEQMMSAFNRFFSQL